MWRRADSSAEFVVLGWRNVPASRVPTAILDLKGSFKEHPDRARHEEPEPEGDIGDPPDRLSESEREAWRTIASESLSGVLCRSDRTALELAARLLAEMWEKGRNFPRERWTELRHYLSSFGMTPADRSRVAVRNGPKKSRLAEVLSLGKNK